MKLYPEIQPSFYVTCNMMAKARIVEEEVAIARQWHSKHVSTVSDTTRPTKMGVRITYWSLPP
jgi:hypothetical protein